MKERQYNLPERKKEMHALEEVGGHHTMLFIMMLAYTSFHPKAGLGWALDQAETRPQVHAHCWVVQFDHLSL